MKKTLVLLLSCLITACGGGGSGSGSGSGSAGGDPSKTGTARIEGSVYWGSFADAEISVYAWDGEQGELLGSTTADSHGSYSVELNDVSNQTVLISANGSYYRPVSDVLRIMPPGASIVATTNIKVGQTVHASLTMYSQVAVGLATYKLSLGLLPPDATKQANEAISDWVGYDILAVDPADLRSVVTTGGLNDQLKASLLTGAYHIINPISRPIILNNQVVGPLAQDGTLDGDMFRHDLAAAVLYYANVNAGTSGIDSDSLVRYATAISQAAGPLFGNKEPAMFDATKPIFFRTSPTDNLSISGLSYFSTFIAAPAGIDEVSLYVNGTLFEYAGQTTDPVISVDTRSYTDGPLIATFVATDNLGATTEKDITVYVSNVAPVVSDFQPTDGSRISGNVNFHASVSSPTGVSYVRFLLDNNQVYMPIDGSSLTEPSVIVDTATISGQDAQHTMTLEAISQSGVKMTETIHFYLDNIDPSLTWNLDSRDYIEGTFTLNSTATDNIAVKEARLFIDGDLVQTFSSESISYGIDTTNYPDGDHPVAIEVEDAAGNVKTIIKTVLFDNTDPAVVLTTPANGTVLTSDFQIVANMSDSGGLDGEVVFLVDGVQYSAAYPDSTVSTTLNIQNYSNGSHTVGVKVTDRAGHTTTRSNSVTFSY